MSKVINAERDSKIFAQFLEGARVSELAKSYNISGSRISTIIQSKERRWRSKIRRGIIPVVAKLEILQGEIEKSLLLCKHPSFQEQKFWLYASGDTRKHYRIKCSKCDTYFSCTNEVNP